MRDHDAFDDLGPEDLGWHAQGDRDGGADRNGRGFRAFESSVDFMARMRPPDHSIDGLVERGNFYTLTAPTGHGKTSVALLATAAVVHTGMFGWREAQRGSALFLAGENPDNIRRQWYALCRYLGADAAALPVYWHEEAFGLDGASMERALEAANEIPDLRLVVADTLQAFFTGDDFNDNVQMLATARALRAFSRDVASRPTVICPAHPVKGATRDALVPFGGGAILNECDGNLTLWSSGETTTLHWHRKHRGADFDPMPFRLHRFEPPGMVDARGRAMPMTIALPLTQSETEQSAQNDEAREVRLLRAVKADAKITTRLAAEILGVGKTSAAQLIQELRRRKWITSRARKLFLTAEGDEVLGDA